MVTGGLLLLALFLLLIPESYQRPLRSALRTVVLRPFLVAQERLAAQRARSFDVSLIRAERDSLAALAAAQSALAEENHRLRELLELRSRVGDLFLPAEVMRVGSGETDGTFMLGVGTQQGVRVGSPVLASEGLLGLVWEVDATMSQAIDWTHPDFRASAMTADGQTYGIVEPRRGRFREEDALVLTGAPFHSDIRPGARIVTSGRGGLIPRGVPLGTVVGIEEADTGWRKTYVLRPAVRPEAASHVLVGLEGGPLDLASAWDVAPARPARPAPPDTTTSDPGT